MKETVLQVETFHFSCLEENQCCATEHVHLFVYVKSLAARVFSAPELAGYHQIILISHTMIEAIMSDTFHSQECSVGVALGIDPTMLSSMERYSQ